MTMNEKILVVDDEPEILEVLAFHLKVEGFSVVTAASGEEGVERFETDSFDLLITDMKMPGMDGIDLLRYVKARDKDIEVIILTGYGTLENAIEALRNDGAYDYLRKPLEDIEELSVSVAQALTHRQLVLDKKRLSKELSKANSDLEEKVRQRTAELDEMVQTLNQAKEAAELANISKNNFLISMNHELKTPLNSIISFSYILESQLTDEQKKYAANIQKSGQHLLSLINDVLEMARVETGDTSLHISGLALPAILGNCLPMLQEQAKARSITFDIEIAKGMRSLLIPADSAKVKQIFFNLLSNAIKFSNEGSNVTVAMQLIPEGQEPAVEISISDTGIGIPLDLQEKIFEPFYQIGNILTAKPTGQGLGLGIAKNYVELHGGTLSVVSKGEGQGSRFIFTLPLHIQNL